MNYAEIISRLIALGLSPLPVAPFQAEPVGKRTGKPIFTGKNPSYRTGGAINAELVNHAHYQNQIPSQQLLEAWFRFIETGIGCLGSDRYRWLDLDRKHFATQGDCDLALLSICPHAQEGWLERTQSGGYRLLVDCGENGADFTNFALIEGGDHVGELLGAGRFAVLAPSVGVNGNYENLNYGDPIPLAELNIFTTAKKQEFVPTFPLLTTISASAKTGTIIELFSCTTSAVQSIITGNPESDDRSADVTKAAKELYGWVNWLNANQVNFNGSADALINDCGEALGIDSDRIERIKKTVDPASCLPACVIRGDNESAQNRVRKLQYALSPSTTQDLRYSAPAKTDDINNIDLLDLLPKKYIEAVHYGIDKPSAILPIIKGLAVATEAYLINKSIKYRSKPQEIFTQFCKNQEPPIQADFDSIPSDDEEIDIPAIKKTLAAYNLAQKKIKERIEREALKAERERIKAELKAEEKCELAKNISIIKKFFGDRFRLNLLTKEVELDGEIFDIDTARIMFAEEINININKNDAIDAIAVIAQTNSYHPVFDYLEDCHARIGDSTSILDGLAQKCFGVENPLYEAFLKKTLIAAVARIYYPLTKFDDKKIPKVAKVDHVFCLVSTQGAKKSTFFETLAGEAFFTDNLDKELAHKDNIMRLHRKWICEIGEIDRVTNSKYEGDLKNFITIKTDIQRFAYLRAQKTCPRQFIFVGTSNRDDFLTDPTGDRRYWIVRTNKKINLGFIEENRDEIWAAAVSLYKSGAEWWLSEVEQEASNHNNRRYQSDSPWMPTIADFCEYKEKVSVTEILYRIEPQRAKHSHLMQRDVANCLTRLGYAKSGSRHRALIDGANLQVYSWVLSHPISGDNSPLSQPETSAAYSVENIQQNITNSPITHPSNPYPVTHTSVYELGEIGNMDKSSMENIYIENGDKKTCIEKPVENFPSKTANSLTHVAPNPLAAHSPAKLGGELGVSYPESSLRPVTVSDFGKTIYNIVDKTSGVLLSLEQDGVHYGDYVAAPQNVRVVIEHG